MKKKKSIRKISILSLFLLPLLLLTSCGRCDPLTKEDYLDYLRRLDWTYDPSFVISPGTKFELYTEKTSDTIDTHGRQTFQYAYNYAFFESRNAPEIEYHGEQRSSTVPYKNEIIKTRFIYNNSLYMRNQEFEEGVLIVNEKTIITEDYQKVYDDEFDIFQNNYGDVFKEYFSFEYIYNTFNNYEPKPGYVEEYGYCGSRGWCPVSGSIKKDEVNEDDSSLLNFEFDFAKTDQWNYSKMTDIYYCKRELINNVEEWFVIEHENSDFIHDFNKLLKDFNGI